MRWHYSQKSSSQYRHLGLAQVWLERSTVSCKGGIILVHHEGKKCNDFIAQWKAIRRENVIQQKPRIELQFKLYFFIKIYYLGGSNSKFILDKWATKLPPLGSSTSRAARCALGSARCKSLATTGSFSFSEGARTHCDTLKKSQKPKNNSKN